MYFLTCIFIIVFLEYFFHITQNLWNHDFNFRMYLGACLEIIFGIILEFRVMGIRDYDFHGTRQTCRPSKIFPAASGKHPLRNRNLSYSLFNHIFVSHVINAKNITLFYANISILNRAPSTFWNQSLSSAMRALLLAAEVITADDLFYKKLYLVAYEIVIVVYYYFIH